MAESKLILFLTITTLGLEDISKHAQANDFPLSKFLNSKTISKYKYSNALCNSSYYNGYLRCCDCDKHCWKFKSCCADVLWESNSNITMSVYVTKFMDITKQYKNQECEIAFPYIANLGYHSYSYYMVTTCEGDADINDKKLCLSSERSPLLSVPVVGSDDYVYKNYYCARCNFVDEFEMVNISQSCVSNDRTNKKCNFGIRENAKMSHVFRCCNKNAESNKHCESGSKFYGLCRAHKGHVGGEYSNYYCDLCNNNGTHSKGVPTIAHCKPAVGYNPPRPFSWSSLLRFSDPSLASKIPASKQSMNASCNGTSFEDLFDETCSKFTCPNGYNLSGKKCIRYKNIVPLQPTWLPIINEVEGYISVIGSAISLFFYVAIIVTFTLFKELQTIPALCGLALCICLFIGDILFLVANIFKTSKYNGPKELCQAVGIILHFSLIAAQFWGSFMAFDLFINITSIKANRRGSKKKKVLTYSFIVFMLSAIFVITAIILDQTDIIKVKYGENGVCVLQGFHGRIIFYFAPLALSFVVSLSLLTQSIWKISKANRENKEVLSKSKGRKEVNFLCIAIKLVIICGISEGVGFVIIQKSTLSESELIVNVVFGMLYSILKGFRGMMLFVVYICRKEVFNICRKKGLGSKTEDVA